MHGKKHGVGVRGNNTVSVGKDKLPNHRKWPSRIGQGPTDHQGHKATDEQKENTVPQKLFGNYFVIEGKNVFRQKRLRLLGGCAVHKMPLPTNPTSLANPTPSNYLGSRNH